MSKLTDIVRQWCSKTDIKKLNSYLGLPIPNNQQEIIPKSKKIYVTVECAGSGKVLSYGLVISENETILSLRKKIHKLLPINRWYNLEKHKIFIGHGGPELDRIDQIKHNDTLVIFPITKDMLYFKTHDPICILEYSPNGNILASGYINGDVILSFITDNNIKYESLEGYNARVNSIAFNSDSNMLAVGYNHICGIVKLWNISAKGSIIIDTLRLNDDIYSCFPKYFYFTLVLFRSNNDLLIYGSRDNIITFWNVNSKKCSLIKKIKLTYHNVSSSVFSPNGKMLVTYLFDGLIKLWYINKSNNFKILGNLNYHVKNIKFNQDSNMLVFSDHYNNIHLYDLKNNNIKKFFGHSDHITSIAFSPDNKMVIAGAYDGMVKLWNISKENESLIWEKKMTSQYITSLTFSPNGRVIAIGCCDKSLRLFDINKLKIN